jgi:hypothetical protein
MKIYSTTPHFYNNSPLRIYLAGEQMLEKSKQTDKSLRHNKTPAYVISGISSISNSKKSENKT